MFDANAIKYAVLGHPIGHSRSPEIQNLLFEMTDYNGVYMAFDMPPEKLDDALPFFKEYFKGFNCTIPLKEKIIPYLDLLDARAKWCGSVNTVKVRDGKLYGYSTDGIGLTGALAVSYTHLIILSPAGLRRCKSGPPGNPILPERRFLS